jgi:ferredoxin
MDAQLLTRVAFHLTGQNPGPIGAQSPGPSGAKAPGSSAIESLEPIDGLGLRPALAARYRDLTTLRYDFPLVLVDGRDGIDAVQSLSGLVDAALGTIAQGDDGERVSRHVLRLEQRLRAMVAGGARGPLSTLWAAAAASLGAGDDERMHDSFSRARAAIAMDGSLVDCDASLPARLLTQGWRAVQVQKARRRSGAARRLTQHLSDILGADFARSPEGRAPSSLKASIGAFHESDFDFTAMSRILTPSKPQIAMAPARVRRIRDAIVELESDPFDLAACAFTSAVAALAAYRERLPTVAAIAKATAIAELEISGAYRESMHDAIFGRFRPEDLDADDIAPFPDYLVTVQADGMTPVEQAAVMDILSAGLPIKVLVQTDDVLDEPSAGDGHFGFGAHGRQITNMALGLGHAYVLQSSSAFLYQMRRRIFDGLTFPGPALFSVFSGASGHSDGLGPYLTAAAATESRAFPCLAYDPAAGPDWSARFSIDANPQPEADWPTHQLTYEDARHQVASEDLPFTLMDFVASDARHAGHFARLTGGDATEGLVRAGEVIARPLPPRPDRVPYISMVDAADRVQTVLVDDKVIRAARRCRDLWMNVRHMARTSPPAAVGAPVATVPEPAAAAAQGASAPVVPVAAGSAAGAPSPAAGDPYIETPRCSTCNECTQINPRMFAYNDNKQAYIKDPTAGTYAQLVQAAESCQVSIIHPGKPRNPNEPGLAELVARAEAFQ